jgi:hypothetical protein
MTAMFAGTPPGQLDLSVGGVAGAGGGLGDAGGDAGFGSCRKISTPLRLFESNGSPPCPVAMT